VTLKKKFSVKSTHNDFDSSVLKCASVKLYLSDIFSNLSFSMLAAVGHAKLAVLTIQLLT